MHQTSWHALDIAKKSAEGQFFDYMTSMLFAAFCLEAYFNHLGELRIKYWRKIDRIRFEDKFEILAQIVNLQIDWSCRPLQTFKEIIEFRNKIAHARTEYLVEETEQYLAEAEDPKLPQSKWKEKINLENAQRFFDDTEKIIRQLHTLAGFKRDPFGIPEISDWWIGPVE
jgi:hypothetical protein